MYRISIRGVKLHTRRRCLYMVRSEINVDEVFMFRVTGSHNDPQKKVGYDKKSFRRSMALFGDTT